MRAYGINVNLGGNINLIGREPRDGRTFETKGEDPILAGKITAAHIKRHPGPARDRPASSTSPSTTRKRTATANAIIDERSGRESDLLAFEIGVKDSNVQSVMCSYNLVNGQYACENSLPAERCSQRRLGVRGFCHVGLAGHAQHGEARRKRT